MPTFVERLARTLAAATPEVFPPPDSAGAIIDMPEADLVRITERWWREIAAQGTGGAGGPRGAGGAGAASATRST